MKLPVYHIAAFCLFLAFILVLCSLACGQTLEYDHRSAPASYVIDLDKMWGARIDVMRATNEELRWEVLRLRQGMGQYRKEELLPGGINDAWMRDGFPAEE